MTCDFDLRWSQLYTQAAVPRSLLPTASHSRLAQGASAQLSGPVLRYLLLLFDLDGDGLVRLCDRGIQKQCLSRSSILIVL
jgi:hypothetical protein